jgi:hypothetical protein
LFAFNAELLAKPNGGAWPVKVAQPQVERTFASSPRFEMEPDEQQVKVRILAGGPDRVDDFAQLAVIEGTAAIREAPWLLQLSGRAPGDDICPLGPGEECSQRSDAALAG